jgi:hypothetical protein
MNFWTLEMGLVFLIVAFYVAWFVIVIVFWGLAMLFAGIVALWEAMFND